MSHTQESPTRSPIPVRTAAFAAAIGAWVLWSGVILTGTGLIIVSNFLAGAVIAAAAAYTAGWPDGGPLPAVLAPILVTLGGLWVLVTPFVFEGTVDRLLWSNVISGVLVVVLAAGSVYGSWQVAQSRTTRT